jgi:hypothetical protein
MNWLEVEICVFVCLLFDILRDWLKKRIKRGG